jgi:hypothetical protein
MACLLRGWYEPSGACGSPTSTADAKLTLGSASAASCASRISCQPSAPCDQPSVPQKGASCVKENQKGAPPSAARQSATSARAMHAYH